MRNLLSCVALACLGSATLVASRCAADPVLISSLDLHLVDQEWGKPQADRSVDGKPISIGGTRFEHGLGTHAAGVVRIDLGGGAERFTAHVGIDDDVRGDDGTEKPGSSVVFRV